MRSFLKIFVTAVVLACGFAGYLLYQPKSALQSKATNPPAVQRLRATKGDALVGGGDHGWVRQFDNAGALSSRFRLQEWEQQENGLIHVIRPEAELYFKGKGDARARVLIQGVDGEVAAEGLPGMSKTDSPLDPKNMGSGGLGSGPAQPPSSGRLNNVVISVYESDAAKEPVLTMRTNNIVFDNEAFRISTETYTGPDGKVVPADQVPVSVEGRDFDFYGRGLTVRWNDVDERLELLRIARGDRLVIKNPGVMSGSLFGGKEKKADDEKGKGGTVAGLPRPPWAPLWPMLVSADSSAAGAAIEAAGKGTEGGRKKRRKDKSGADQAQTRPVRHKEQPPYRAVFNEHVVVVEGEQRVATADLMNVDFLLGSQDDDKAGKGPTTRKSSSTAPASGPVTDTGSAAASGATEGTTSSGPTTHTADGSDDEQQAVASTQSTRPSRKKSPTTAPAVQPITIYWVGDMTVTPSAVNALPTPLARGDAGVELVGKESPVELKRQNATVRCARFAYRSDNTLAIDKSDKFPLIVLTHQPADDEAPETRLTTESVWYSFAERVARLKGRSRVTAPVDDEKGQGHPGTIDAAWREVATFHLRGEKQEELTLERADFNGDVDVKAPQGAVQAQQLALLFDPAEATDTPALDVEKKAGGKPRRATTTAQPFGNSKQPDLRRVIATQNVFCQLTDAGKRPQTVKCDRLDLETAKSDEGKLYPYVIDAAGSVHASDASQDLRAGHVVLKLKPGTRKEQPEQPDAEVDDLTSRDPLAAAGSKEEIEEQKVDEQLASAKPAAKGKAGAGKAQKTDTNASTDDRIAGVALESLLATEAVEVRSRDGAVATGLRLSITADGDADDPHVELTGEPARVVDAKNGTLTARRILVDPKSGVAHVPGEGSLRTIVADEKDATKPGRPVEVAWADGADLNGRENKVDVTGKVVVCITETDGTVSTGTAGRVNVRLVEKPNPAEEQDSAEEKNHVEKLKPARDSADPLSDDSTDEPAPRAVARKSRKSGDAAPADELAGSMKMDVFKNKDVGVITLRDDAAVDSELRSADGKTLLRRFHLKSDVLQYDVPGRHLSVPGPGQMLVESHENKDAGAEAKQAKDAKADDDPAALAMSDGTTAFQWADRLEFEAAAGKAVMDGEVVVTHRPDAEKEPPVRLDADQVTALFVPRPADAGADKPSGKNEGAAAAASAGVAGAGLQRLQIKSVSAVGNIEITRDGAELSAGRIDFDPATNWVIARGTGRTPAVFTDPAGTGSARASELWLNTKTWQVKVVDAATRVGGLAR